MRSRLHKLLAFFIVLWPQLGYGAPDTTMSVTPACTAGTTITCADETTRNNNISTPYNAHSHTDISQVGNTLNVGDGAAGNKNLCFNAADSTDRCFRFDDTANLVLVDNPEAGTFNQVATITGTAGLTDGGLVYGSGTSSLRALAVATNGQLPIGDGTGAPTLATLTQGSGITITNAAGSITIASSVTATVSGRVHRTAGDVTTTSTSLVDFTGASVTLTTQANPVLVGFTGACDDSTANNIAMGVQVDNTSNELGTGGMVVAQATGGQNLNCSFTMLLGAQTAGSHTFDLQWSVGAGTGTADCSTTSPCNFWVVEVTD